MSERMFFTVSTVINSGCTRNPQERTMTFTISTNEADAAAAEAVVDHHAQLLGALALLADGVVDAAAAGDSAVALERRDRLHEWCQHELVPHAQAEEEGLYPAAHDRSEGRLLIDGMLAEHAALAKLVDALDSDDPTRLAATAHTLHIVFGLHIDKENDLVLPLLASAPDVSLEALLGGMHELLGHDDNTTTSSHDDEGHVCGCHEPDDQSYPELDARLVPHATRHATIFGALDAALPGGGIILIAPHDPLPLLAQLEQRSPNTFSVSYLERGPEMCRLSIG